MKRLFLLLVCVGLSVTAVSQTERAIDPSLANQYFQEARSVSEKDMGQLWGVPIYGPMMFADPNTRFVVANQADANGLLRKEGAVFVGTLPEDAGIANTATKWSGVTWTMVMWPLPSERQRRVRLMMHELFHRLQDSLKLAGANPTNRHLESRDGRIWLRIELRALERALFEQGTARRDAVADAIYFRRYRQSLFQGSAAEENALETNEGLSEYTGVKLSARSDNEALIRSSYSVRVAGSDQSFTRSFAYATGPAYALLLDSTGTKWRRTITSSDDLSTMLQNAMRIKLPAVSRNEASARAGRYDGDEVFASETVREKRRQETMAKYRGQLVDGPVLVLPIGSSFSYTFDPNNVAAFEELGLVYPTARVTDDWGILEVTDGVLMFRDAGVIKKLQVAAPASAGALQGTGWKLRLNDGWELAPGDRKGDFLVRKKS
jgi:hypothetical protein